MHTDRIEILKSHIQSLREKLVQHPLYKSIDNLEKLQIFMSCHVFAVWDFMSLLKSLQQQLTCVSLPWVPVGSATTRYLINEIVTGEESDIDQHGIRTSHFELYLKAMEEAGAATTSINQLLAHLRDGQSIEQALNDMEVPEAVRAFVKQTFSIIATKQAHIQAAVFTFGREDLIPDMFVAMVKDINTKTADKASTFQYYLERHIEVDGDHHSHLAYDMTKELCGDDDTKWQEATRYVKLSLEARLALWDGVYAIVDRV